MPRLLGFVPTKKMLLDKLAKDVLSKVESTPPKVEPEPKVESTPSKIEPEPKIHPEFTLSVEIPTIDSIEKVESPLPKYEHELQSFQKPKKIEDIDLNRKVDQNPLEESENELVMINSR